MADIWVPLAQGQIPKIYTPGQLIYLQDTEPRFLYYLLDGAARSFISSPEGNERVLTLHRSGDLMGEASFFDGCPRVSSAAAVTECKVISVDRERLERVFAAHPELAFPMLQYLSRTVRLLSSHVDGISFQSANRRLASTLLQHMSGENTLQITHEELGALIGASRVTVNRALSQFAYRGWIKTGYRFIRILAPDKLFRFAQEGK